MKWVHFILNKIHEQLEQPVDDFYDSLEKYYDEYKPKEIRNKELIKREKIYTIWYCVINNWRNFLYL